MTPPTKAMGSRLTTLTEAWRALLQDSPPPEPAMGKDCLDCYSSSESCWWNSVRTR
jgi:hypothetical protein